jgi:CubicO group peptidase (beta-lactamase class C family)
MKKVIVAIVLFVQLPLASAVKRLDGSSISSAEIDAVVTRLMGAAEVTGAGITIFNRGKIRYQKTFGFRDTERKLPLTEDSVMAAASFTKVAFSYLVLQMVDERELDLDKPVHEYLPGPLPDYPAYRDLDNDTRYRKITARMLLSHTSGFPNFRRPEDQFKLKIHFDPGTKYAYSGEGMQLLQLIVETITQKPLKDLMRERVFQPLGMKRTSMTSEESFDTDYANGYDEWGRSLDHPRVETAGAAGSMQTTPRNFAIFMQAIIDGKGLSRRTREIMLSPQIQIFSQHQFPTLEAATTDKNKDIRLSYGLGWGLYWSPHGEAFFKEGHEDGFRNYTVVFEKSKDGIVIMTNSSNGEGIFKELLEVLLKDTFTPIEWEGFTPYNELPPRKPLPVHHEITLAPAQLDALAGRYAISPELVLTVTRKEGYLLLKENQEPPEELFPEGELQFFSKTSDDVLTFELDASGLPARFVIHTGGQAIPVNRAK